MNHIYLIRLILLKRLGFQSQEYGMPRFIPGVSNSNGSVDQMRTCKVTRGPHYDADETIAVPEFTKSRFYILLPSKGIMNYRHIISSRLYVRINQF